MKIAIDIDGVILDYIDQLRAYADFYDYTRFQKKGVKNKQALKLKDRYDWSNEELDEFVNDNFVQLTYTTNFKPLSREIINLLKEDGNDIYIVSYRGKLHPELKKIIKSRFDDYGIKIDKYYWGIKDKLKVFKKEKIDIVIDDSPDICKKSSKNKIFTLYFREKDMPILKNDYLVDVDNWGQIYKEIKNRSKRSFHENKN